VRPFFFARSPGCAPTALVVREDDSVRAVGCGRDERLMTIGSVPMRAGDLVCIDAPTTHRRRTDESSMWTCGDV